MRWAHRRRFFDMHTLIVGAGAVGGYIGARLHQSGRAPAFLVRPRRARILQQRGLQLHTLAGTQIVQPRLLTPDAVDRHYDLILLAVKATDLYTAIDAMRPAVGPDTLIVPILNGMNHFPVLDGLFGRNAVLGGIAKVVTSLTDDGDIRQFAEGASLIIGKRAVGTDQVRFDRTAVTLDVDGIGFAVSEDIDRDLWHKWVFIASIGAANCLLGGTAGEIAAVAGGTEVATGLIEEAASISAAAGFPLDPSFIAEPFHDPASILTSSMYRDVRNARRVEAESIVGDLVLRGRALGVDVPLLNAAAVALRVWSNRRDKAVQQTSRE
jgi:2-dehydropantoate 2-reductase